MLDHRIAGVLLASLMGFAPNASLAAQQSLPEAPGRQYVVTLDDKVVRALAVADSQILGKRNVAGLRGLGDELIQKLCELHTLSGAEHPMRELRRWVSNTGFPGSDSTLFRRMGAACQLRKGDGSLGPVSVMVLTVEASPAPASDASLDHILLTASTQIIEGRYDGEGIRWLWWPHSGWQLVRYNRKGVDDFAPPPEPPIPLVRIPVTGPPRKP
jgi:hypothetical protein